MQVYRTIGDTDGHDASRRVMYRHRYSGLLMTQAIDAIFPGTPAPLGAHYDGAGVNFAVYSETARSIDLCLFDAAGRRQVRRIKMIGQTGSVFHVYMRGLEPGTLYGFRARGTYRPRSGHLFNPSKLLVDPYARALAGMVDWRAPLHTDVLGADGLSGRREAHDDAAGVPKCIVVSDHFDWQDDRPPAIPWRDTVIYEVHVKGFTQCHPELPPELRGTYSGLASEPAIRHLKALGMTAVELLPVHAHADSEHLYRNRLVNYWGYDTLGFFAPEARYSSRGDRGGQVGEFKEMVRTLHRNGIEVLLDVVYNHTCEGNEHGPMLSLKGLDNATYYRLDPQDLQRYVDVTGTGNTLNTWHPQTLRLVMDSLRYWVEEMHVDGFRFDLASTLARTEHAYERLSPFLQAVHQDPVLSRVKLIAEPWDTGEGGYQVSGFPAGWSEWNGKYRDAVRHFWRADEGFTHEVAYRLSGSSDLYNTTGRMPDASINFVTAHDGFTLHDLVSYNEKHNAANAENNRDGTDDNITWNCGIEGPTNDPAVLLLRERQKRNFIATLLLSHGVPMLLGGDELSRTQRGNNNAYCQDNEVSWFDWDLDGRKQAFLDFTKRMTDLRRRHPGLRRQHFFHGRPVRGSTLKDLTWLRDDGTEMTDAVWFTPWNRCIGMLLDGETDEIDCEAAPITDDVILVLLNAFFEPVRFRLPATKTGDRWRFVFDTARPQILEETEAYLTGEVYTLEARSMTMLCCRNSEDL
jgi:glycogen operon protein